MYRELVCNDERFTRKTLFNSSISEYSAGKISINTLLGMWDSGVWIERDPVGNDWYVYRLEGNRYFAFDRYTHTKRKFWARKFLIQYSKYPNDYKIPYENGGEVDINLLKKLYDTNTSLFGL